MIEIALKQIKTSLCLLILLSLLTGFLYPCLITGLAQLLFPFEANGSLIEKDKKYIGSRLIGQAFSSAAYFWSRPSATTPYPYNGAASSGSNLGPSNPDFLATVSERIELLKKVSPNNDELIPVDLVTASGSGLDPEISPLAAFYQIPRIAKARHIDQEILQALVRKWIKTRSWGILGEPRVNVLELNLALDKLRSDDDQSTTQP